MQQIAGRPVLAHVLTRCRSIEGCDVVVCAVPDQDESAPLEAVARDCGARVCYGPESDALGRYAAAARMVSASVVMRVTSDCPLIDPEVCSAVLELREREQADYAANNMPRSFPHGLDCEAFTAEVLAEADRTARDAYDREHVTPWMRRASHLKRANLSSRRPSLEAHRWTLDYPEDLEFFRGVFSLLPPGSRGLMDEVLRALADHSEVTALNAMHRQPQTAESANRESR